MLFRKKHPRCCGYCSYGTAIDNGLILCVKRGAVDGSKPCRRFSYDPCKRIPSRQKALNFQKYNEEDYSL